ncbi:Protein Lines [Macleaya cordata]|uniref:Protein Lines n=1 Tax=Macleaya cordata TaxID=56857 RepID=A0A200QJ45_MACCD|nr:Protein Lines [Macleaya cordata]
MSCHPPDHARLCRLINDSLLPYYSEPQTISLTKEKETNLLIVLSQVSREIRSWENLHHFDSQQGLHSHSGDHHNCSANIVSVLVTFLTNESQYVRQSTSNLLVVISNFLAESGKKWDGFLDFLCLCLRVAISNLISPLSLSPIAGITDLDSHTVSFNLSVQGRLENANWLTMACLIQVLRNILKHLKQDYGDELVERYVHSVSYCLADISWDFLNDIHSGQTSEAHLSSSMNRHGKVGSPKSSFLFLGALLQLFCSLTHQSSFMEVGDGSLNKHLLLDKITSLVPKLLNWCFHKQGDYDHVYASPYLRHKMLMLMIRLSSQIQWQCSTLILWLHLLRKYFDDLLHKPIFGRHAGLDDCLEGSPFQADVVYGQLHKICIPHLQRQAIFLFLRCSFSLISLSKETDMKCSCSTSNSRLTCQLQYAQECCNRKKGLSELSEWLQRHVPLETFVDCGMYLEKCRGFALSFLQLYVDEDDFLFEVLLQLWNLPFPARQVEYNRKGKVLEEVEGDILFHLSNVLNPVHLFHLFLAELHYDHLVLLDYLISKDTGVHCVKYLLRCLRTISNSWHAFVEYSLHEVELSPSSVKKRKCYEDDADSCGKIEPPSAMVEGGRDLGVLDRQCKRNEKLGSMHNSMRGMTFENAKQCLLSLKRSVESLHEKNLFPYNPAALLRSFIRFQELCHQEEKAYHPKVGGMT